MTEQPTDAPELEALRLLDYGTESDLVEAATAYARAVLPEWEPRAGNTEVVLMQSLAIQLGPEILAVQLMRDRVIEGLMNLYGVTRSPGAEATGRAVFTVTASNPTQIIPAGSRLRLLVSSTGETVDFLTVEPLSIITSESLTGEVNIIADTLGTTANGTPAGAPLSVVSPLPFVETVALVTDVGGGAGEESDASFNGRAASVLARQVSTLVQPSQFEYAALSRTDVGRAKAFDAYDPAQPGATVFGHVTVATADAAGQPLAAGTMTELGQWLTAQALASLAVHVIAPTYTTVNIDATVKAAVGYDEADVKARTEQALRDYLNPATWDWAPTVTQYGLVGVLGNVPGVREVQSAPANIALAGKAPLPTVGSITVTVV
ncbi:baseplate J protein [Arthrobacter phage Abba]|uniref:Baseplate J protein n=1 Tax=Arthrobacter phage Abba TaxID=2713256 RepID=A0A6G8R2D1_9CAUD|nr:baseplate J protein [Arthrobacter phage Abba]QIN94360.1 baseplate J protein [Arthrobacter phage Abba]